MRWEAYGGVRRNAGRLVCCRRYPFRGMSRAGVHSEEGENTCAEGDERYHCDQAYHGVDASARVSSEEQRRRVCEWWGTVDRVVAWRSFRCCAW